MAIFKTKDFLTGMSFLLITVVVYLQTLNTPQPDVILFPRVAAYFIGILGIISVCQSVLNKSPVNKASIGIYSINFKMFLIVVSMLIMAAMLNFLGFYESLALFILFMYMILIPKTNVKSIIKGGIFSSVSVVILYLVFNVVIRMVTPRGVLF